MKGNRAVVLWTGGKDCNLALHEARKSGYEILSLVTFAMGTARFLAHPLHFMKKQAQAMDLTHTVIPVQEPYKESYENAIAGIKRKYKIETIITGDIAEVHGNTNWISERSEPCGVKVFLPLWHSDRETVLEKIIALNFKVIFSCVKEPWFTGDWLGKELTRSTLQELNELHISRQLDICGEQGEYHTMVLNSPEYHWELFIDSYTARKKEAIRYMEIGSISMKEKNPLWQKNY
jgi:diphthine-ammonia ligase